MAGPRIKPSPEAEIRARLGTLSLAISAPCEAATHPFTGLTPKPGPCPQYSSAVSTDINKAYELADHGMPAGMIAPYFIIPRMVGLCAPARVAPFHLDSSVARPTKAFDQLYYVGNHFVGSWALPTSPRSE